MQTLSQLLEKYWSGDYSETELQQLKEMLQKEDQELYLTLFRDLPEDKGRLSREDAARILKEIHHKMGATPTATFRRLRVSATGWWRAAAAVVLLAGASFWIYQQSRVHRSTPSPEVAMDRSVVKLLENKGRQPVKVALPDSSVVELFPGSVLSYKENFEVNHRRLDLSGKASFAVAKDAARPFTVHAKGVHTTALGTAFIIDTRLDSNQVNVRLTEGRVLVTYAKNGAGKEVYLKAGQECTVHLTGGKALVSTFRKNEAIGIPPERLVKDAANMRSLKFHKESLTGVFDKLSKQFQVHIEYDNKAVKSLSFTGEFTDTDSLQMILSIICKTNDLIHEYKGDSITIRK